MAERTKLQERYQLEQVLGRGGMGVVYRARDTLMNRHVALKTILDVENRSALDLFYKEWGVQASICHPNIVEIYDIGEFEENGATRPFFVMPLLPGNTLDQLIRDGSATLTVERSIGIICQACRGLQAAHDHGLVHRDLKPSNLFVMADDSVKIIDFGVAHLVSTGAKTTLKGTLSYMAPEQLEMKAPSALSDIFSLAVVCYQTLTRRLPFQGNSEYEITEAILKHSPAPISDINTSVNEAISSVVHKAMAKRPWHRFPAAKDYAEALQKALHNQPLAFLDTEKIKPRIQRATKSFEQGDYTFASEILFELEAEGILDPQITLMRRQLDQAVRKLTIRQLLENARRFFEAHEYGLALRKTQEALELDADDTDALALKGQIEKEQREKQIDEWFSLARQHVDNQAFGQARQAIESVLKLKPNDTQALRLSADVERLERDAAHAREEKKKLYEAAMHAWQKGEITVSLNKLESLVSLEEDRPDTDGDRSATYQKFYQQVRSEHDTIKNAYDEARTKLQDGDFTKARTLCDQYLAKYPYHALFQSLKVDLEERQRQKLSAFIAETDQRVDNEPDLDRRMGILEEALKAYPSEAHFERAMRTVREKRDLVNSIVAKARFFEEKTQLNEALDQWQILRSIHNQYPGLEIEIERLAKRRDQQVRTQAKARWGEQIDRHLETGDYDRAVEIAKGALQEFPDDGALIELDQMARKSRERATEAMAVLSEGRELCDKGQTTQGLDLMRRAYQLDQRSPVPRKVLVNYLITTARQLVDTDWKSAEKLIKEVLDLEPNHTSAQSLRNQISDQRREEFVSECVAQARRLQSEGDMGAAKSVVETGLASYPDEPRLKQLLGTIQRAQSAGPAKVTQNTRGFDDLKHIEKTIAAGNLDSAQAGQLAEQVRLIASKSPQEGAIQSLAADLRGRLGAVIAANAPQPSAQDAEWMTASDIGKPAFPIGAKKPEPPTMVMKPPSGVTPATAPQPPAKKVSEVKPAQAAPTKAEAKKAAAAAAAVKQPAPPGKLAPVGKQQKLLLLATAIGVAVVVAIAAAFMLLRKPTGAPPPVASTGGVRVSVQAYPAEALIFVHDQQCGVGACEVNLEPGTYQAQARLPGYQAGSISFDVAAPTPEKPGAEPVVLVLEPMAPVLRIVSDLASGTVSIDGAAAGQLEDGQYEITSLTPGAHTIEIGSGSSKATLAIEVRAGSMPEIDAPIQASSLKVAAVSILGNSARVHTTAGDAAIQLDGQPAGQSAAGGAELSNLQEGAHEVKIGEGRDQLSVPFNTGAVPTLLAFLKSERNVGGLYIETGEDDVTVLLNGKPYRRKTQRGRVVIYLAPQDYTVQVQKQGFEAAPQQVATVVRGEDARLTFKMNPLPETASLTIRNAPPGADVLLDGKKLGTIAAGADRGTFTLPAGTHTIAVHKDPYKPQEWKRDFKAGESVELDGTLQNTSGTLKIEIETSGVDPLLTLRREGENEQRAVSEKTLTLPEGTYTVSARADGYQEYAATVRVAADQTKVIKIAMVREQIKGPQPQSLLSSLAQSGWKQEGKLLTRQGGDFVLLPQTVAPGFYQFTVLVQNGRRLEWVLNFKDDDNYVLFQIDRSQFTRQLVAKGDKEKPVRTRHNADRDDFLSIRLEVGPDSVVTRIYLKQQWVMLDNWQASPGILQGKLGFHIPGRDKIGLSSFTFTPR